MAPAQEHLWRSGQLKWAVWSTLSEKMGSWRRLGIRTPHAPRVRDVYAGGVQGGRVLLRASGRNEAGGPLRFQYALH